MEQTHSFLKNIGVFFLGAIIFFSIGFKLIMVDFWPMHQDSKVLGLLVLFGWIVLLVLSFIISRILIKSTTHKTLRIILVIIIVIIFRMELFTIYGMSKICGVAGCNTDQINLPQVDTY